MFNNKYQIKKKVFHPQNVYLFRTVRMYSNCYVFKWLEPVTLMYITKSE